MSAATDLRAYIIADATVSAITTSAHVNKVPEDKTEPFIWIRESRVLYMDTIGAARAIDRTFFDLECVSEDLSEADQLRAAVAARLEGATGTIGSGTYAWIAVEDHYDDYIARSVDADSDLHLCALAVEVVHQ